MRFVLFKDSGAPIKNLFTILIPIELEVDYSKMQLTSACCVNSSKALKTIKKKEGKKRGRITQVRLNTNDCFHRC